MNKLFVVGLGPGEPAYMTGQARAALEQADVLCGYTVYVEQIRAWKDACVNANGRVAKEAAKLNRELKASEKERHRLEMELARKEKALAETAALLVLRKKAHAIWGEAEDE